jgi:hypothetical protein
VGWDWVHLVRRPLFGLLYQPRMNDRWLVCCSRWNENWQGKPKYSEKTCPSATLFTTNSTSPDLGLNPGRRGGKPAINRLSYGTVSSWDLVLPLTYVHRTFRYRELLFCSPACSDTLERANHSLLSHSLRLPGAVWGRMTSNAYLVWNSHSSLNFETHVWKS